MECQVFIYAEIWAQFCQRWQIHRVYILFVVWENRWLWQFYQTRSKYLLSSSKCHLPLHITVNSTGCLCVTQHLFKEKRESFSCCRMNCDVCDVHHITSIEFIDVSTLMIDLKNTRLLYCQFLGKCMIGEMTADVAYGHTSISTLITNYCKYCPHCMGPWFSQQYIPICWMMYVHACFRSRSSALYESDWHYCCL